MPSCARTTTVAATCRSRVARRAYVGAATAIILQLTLSIATAEPKRLLLVHSFGRDFAPWSEYAKNFRAELDRQWREPVDLYEASLAIAHSQTTRPEGPFIDYLHALFGNHWQTFEQYRWQII